MCFAVAIQRAGFRIIAETHGAVLMGDTRQRDALTQIEIAGENTFVALMPVNRTRALLIHEAPKFLDQAFVTLFVIRFVL